ncbi:AI-2E family transporter [Gordonia iterans]|uniref:AI-2E family transporter n=1 Tax=Gordonia iterans TaxID=1004901 RepID=A0A2S0KDM1_9ACTN|nr:AI-2E family transporter [Gordonia iterans]AVL99791.1 AI-2E family transporter [Gordonia iterans]
MSADRATLAGRIRRWGLFAWSLLGVLGLIVVIALGLSAISGILVPLIVAVILGVVLEPMVAFLERHRVPHTLAATLTLLAAIGVAALTVFVVFRGFIDQWSEIQRQLTLGWNSFTDWARSLDLEDRWLEQARTALEDLAPQVGQGVMGAVASTFYGTVSLFMGCFFALFFMFFVLRDGKRFAAWFATAAHLDFDTVGDVTEISRQSIRGYFRGTAITAVVTAPIFMVPLLLLGVPLAIPIFVLYFFLSFVPFLGAWIAGAFVVLIAFGSGGTTAAAIMAVTFLISNGTIQSAVSSWALGSSLRLHPVSVLLATMIGGTAAGLLGMVLGAPLLAAVVKSVEAVQRRSAERETHSQATPSPSRSSVDE